MYLSSPTHVPHAPPVTSSWMWSSEYYLVRSTVHVMTILNVPFPPSSNFFLPVRPTDLLAPYPRTLSAFVLPLIRGTKFHTHIIHCNAKAPNNSYSFSVSIFDNGRLRKRIATKIQNSFSFLPSWPHVHKLNTTSILLIYQSLVS